MCRAREGRREEAEEEKKEVEGGGKGTKGEKVRSNETLDGSRAALKPPSTNPGGITNRLRDTRSHDIGQGMQS